MFLKDVHKQAPNDLALGLGFAHAGQFAQKQLAGVHADDLGVQFADEHFHHHVTLVQAQQTVVHKNAGELVANGAVDERGRHRRIHAARQAQNDFFVTHLRPDFGNCIGHVVVHHPVGAGGADVEHKAVQQRLALHRVRHFGVKLHAIEMPRLVGHAGNRATRRAGHELEAGRQRGHLVAVAHPDLEHAVVFGRGEVGNVLEQGGMAMGAHFGVAKLARVAAFDLAAELLRHGLHAVANAQHRHAQRKHGGRRTVGAVFVHAGVAA